MIEFTKVEFYLQVIDDKLTPFITKLEKSQKFCEKLQASLEKRIYEFHTLRKESKQNNVRKTQLEKKINDVEQMASEITKQKAEFLQYKENTERKTTDTLLILNKENESVSVYCFYILIIKKYRKNFNHLIRFSCERELNSQRTKRKLRRQPYPLLEKNWIISLFRTVKYQWRIPS